MVQRATTQAVAVFAVVMSALSAGAATVVLEDAALTVGFSTELNLTMSLVNDPGDAVAGGQVDVAFDPSVMTLVGVTEGAAATAAGKEVVYSEFEPGVVRVVVAGLNMNTMADGDLASLQFVVNGGTPGGDYNIGLEELALSDAYGAAVACVADPSVVAVTALPLPLAKPWLAGLAMLGAALFSLKATGIGKCRLCTLKAR